MLLNRLGQELDSLADLVSPYKHVKYAFTLANDMRLISWLLFRYHLG